MEWAAATQESESRSAGHRYFVLTPNRDGHHLTNPGSLFVTYGLKFLVSQADPHAQFFDVNMLEYEADVWDFLCETADVLIFAGNPRLNATEAGVYWDMGIWEHIARACQAGVLFTDLWAGAAYPHPLVSSEEMADSIGRLNKTHAIQQHEAEAALCIVRDALAFELLSPINPRTFLCLCSSWWAKDFLNLPSAEKSFHCITLRSMPGNEWLLDAAARIQQQLQSERPTYILTHTLPDYEWVKQHAPELPDVLCLYNPRTLLEFYAQVDKLVSTRLHGSIPALSLGAQVADIGIDSRCLTLEPFGVKSTAFTELANPDFAPEFQRPTIEPDSGEFVRLFQEHVVSKIDSARARREKRATTELETSYSVNRSTFRV